MAMLRLQEMGARRRFCRRCPKKLLPKLFPVCSTCRQRKTCYRCRNRLPEADFNKTAWKSRHADRRICKNCVLKEKGHWMCASCKTEKEKRLYKRYTRKHPSRPDGRQVCDACWFQAAMLYHASNTNRRLARVRKKLKQKRVTQIVAEIYAHIAQRKQARPAKSFEEEIATARQSVQAKPSVPPRNDGRNSSPKQQTTDLVAGHSKAKVPQQEKAPQHEYLCPFCKATVRSKIYTGQVDHRSICGNQFRVENGRVRLQYQHVCPRCGTSVVAYRSSGRLQSKHRTPKGKECPQIE